MVLFASPTISVCEKRVPNKFGKLSQEYAVWLQKQPADVKAFAKEVDAKKAEAAKDPQMQQHIKMLETHPLDELTEQCQAFSNYLTGALEKPNPALTSPETTWKTFHAAMLARDAKAARQCLTGNALKNFRAAFEAGDGAGMATWAKDVKQFSANGKISRDIVEAFVTTNSGRAYILTLAKLGPNWLIVEM